MSDKKFFELPGLSSGEAKLFGWVFDQSRKQTIKFRIRKKVEEVRCDYGESVAAAYEAARLAGQSGNDILELAERAKRDREDRERVLANPPPIHGSARWATAADVGHRLKTRDAFDTPSSLLLGSFAEEGSAENGGFVHWDADGHLMTLAPTRSGKAVTTIIPNLLRYRGSAVVLDPKGELYAATSKWRAEHVGPVYRIAPFDTGKNPDTANFPKHGFDPLSCIRSQADARALAELLFPRDPKSPEFFSKDAIAYVEALILYVMAKAPPDQISLATVHRAGSGPMDRFMRFAGQMAKSRIETVSDAAEILKSKSSQGRANVRDTINSELSIWSNPALRECCARHDVDFEKLKDRPATVYIDIPFHFMEPYRSWLRVVLKSALDAMLRTPRIPQIPVLFVLDEFLQLGPFPEFRNAIRSHAGAGVRLWFFLQDLAGLEENYPHSGWKPFFNCSVRQFFGTDEIFTAELISKTLGMSTVAFRTWSESGGLSTHPTPWWETGRPNSSTTVNESVQLLGRPLMTPDEIMAELSDWRGDGWRTGIIDMRGPRPFKVRLAVADKSPSCVARLGAFTAS